MNIEELLENRTPTALEKEFESPCPLFKPAENSFSGVYLLAHELAAQILAVRLQEEFEDMEIETERELSGVNGRMDISISAKGGKLSVLNSHRKIATIEVKTGKLKLIQPAVYSFVEDVDVLLVGLETSEIQVVTPRIAGRLLRMVAAHLEKKRRLGEKLSHIRGSTCRRCVNDDCGFAEGEPLRLNEKDNVYEQKVRLLDENLDHLAEKCKEFLRAKIFHEILEKKVPVEARD